jgi:hypothetical protein
MMVNDTVASILSTGSKTPGVTTVDGSKYRLELVVLAVVSSMSAARVVIVLRACR